MANPHRSEVALSLDGVTYNLKLSNNAICAVEQASGKNLFEIISALFKGNVWAASAFLYGGLLANHPGISYEQAAEMVPLNDLLPFMKIIIEMVNAAFPAPDANAETKVNENPQ